MIVSAIVRDAGGGRVAMVRQRIGGSVGSWWAMPGGKVEAGEAVHVAAARELREETGLAFARTPVLAFVVHYFAPGSAENAVVFAFEGVGVGEPCACDPDGDIECAQYVSLPEAITRLAALPHRILREPTLNHLRGETGRGALWSYPPDGRSPLVV